MDTAARPSLLVLMLLLATMAPTAGGPGRMLSAESTALRELCELVPPSDRRARGIDADCSAARPCSWSEDVVSCDASGRVLQINMRGWGLKGRIPSHVRALTALRRLDLSKNSLSGTIPSEMAALTSLTALALQRNSLSGTIPSEMAALTFLCVQ